MNGFKEKVVQEIIRFGKKNHRLRIPALAVVALFLMAYHSVRNFFLQFRYHPVRQRILVCILILSLLAGQIGLLNVFAGSGGGTAEAVEDYGVEAPQDSAAQDYGSKARAAAYAAPTLHPQTLLVTADNENNAHTGTADGDIDRSMASRNLFGKSDAAYPIDLSFTLNELPAQSAYLAVKAYDVDEESGEIDRVYLNDDIYTLANSIGNLSGTDSTWNTTVLEVPIDRLQKGKNVVSVTISSGWVVTVDWMQLVLDGGAVDSNIEEFSLKLKDTATKGGNVTVHSDVTVKQKKTTKYVTEYTLTQMSTGNALDACFGSASSTETVGLTMPLSSPDGVYKITGILKNPSTEEIKAIDSTTFYFIKGIGVGPNVSHTLTPDILTNQDVSVQVNAEQVEGVTNVAVSPASRTVSANGTYNFTVSYQMGGGAQSFTYPIKVDNIDKVAPVITYTPVSIEEDLPLAEAKELFGKALSATDNRKLAEEPFTYTLPADISNNPGTKKITVTAADAVGNKATKVCEIAVTAKPASLTMGELKAVTGSKDSYALKAVLDHAGADTITETGFVWGVMPSPTLDLKNGTVKTSAVIKTKGGTLSASATGLSSGVEYYACAYAKVKDAAGKESVVYSDAKKFGLGIPSYGTFSVSGVSGSTFTITRTGGTDKSQTVYYRTVNGSAIGGTHFTHLAGSVIFADGETSKKVSVSEKSVATAYDSKTATSYSNADRTYSFEIYRVDGGGAINQSKRSQTRTMEKLSSYTVDRTVYTTEKSKTNVTDYTGENGKRIADTTSNQGGEDNNVRFLTNRYNETNYNTNSGFSAYYTDTNQRAYLTATADGWYYRYDLQAYEKEDCYAHAYFGKKKLEDIHYSLSGKSAAVSGVDGQLWACTFQQGQGDAKKHYYFPDTRTGGGENAGYPTNSSGTAASYNSKTYVDLGLSDTCYVYFGAGGGGKDIWYVDGLISYAIVHDKVEPKVIGVAPMAGGTYLPGDPITVALVFDEIVDKTNSGDLSKVAISTNVGTLSYAGGENTNVLYFTGNVSSTASLSGSSALKVTGITNNSYIKDMCNTVGTTASFTSGNTNVIVDATKPAVTITPKTSGSLPRHQATVTATGAAAVQYAWTKDTNLPAYGWQTTTSGTTLTESRGTAGATETWYLHVLATASSGASTHAYQAFSFRQPAITETSVRAGTGTTNEIVDDVWKSKKYLHVKWAGAQTSGTTLTWSKEGTTPKNITTQTGSTYLMITENGTYTVTIKDSYGNVISKSVEVNKIDAVKPTATLQSGSSTGTDATYNALSVAVLPEDSGGSGVAKVEYAWTNTTTAPSSWSTLTAAADGSYQAEYTATETAKTAKYLHVRVTDGAGNVSAVANSGPYQVLRKATAAELPTITVTGNPTAWTKSATLTWTAKAGTGTVAGTIEGVYTPDSNTTPKTGTTGTCTVTKNGIYMFTVTDSNGNSVTKEVLVTKLDNEAPGLTSITATGGKTGTITLTDVTDNCTVVLDAKGNYSSLGGSGVKTRQYQMAGASGWKDFTGDSFTVNKNGTYTVRLTDALGNVGEYSVDMTDIDATAPKVTCTVNATPNAKSGWYTVSTVPVNLTFADEAGEEGGTPSGIQSVKYKPVTDNTVKPTGLFSLGTSTISSGTYTYSITSSYNGMYYLYYEVTDKKGNVTEGFSDLIKKDSNTGSLSISRPDVGQPISRGLAATMTLTYGPSGGYLTGGTTVASAERIAAMEQHATGTKTINAAYTATTSGTHYIWFYPGASGGSAYQKSYFYVRQITFNSQGGSAVESQLIWTTQASSSTSTTVQCRVVKPTDPTRTGYTFGGWYTDAACTAGNEFDFTKQVRVDTTLYAKWTANTYHVAYHLVNPDGSAYAPAETAATYTYGKGLTLPKPTQAGFAFCGWYDNAGYTGTAYTSIAKTAMGDQEYYAYFKDTQAPVIAFGSYEGVVSSGAEDGWQRTQDADTPRIRVSCKDNVGVKEVLVQVDNGSFSKTGVSSPITDYYDYSLQEGEHTYTFKAVDAAGNGTVSDTWIVKLDGTKPKIGEITYEKKVASVLDWIVGQESLIVHIPVTDSISGVASLTYTETAITAAGETAQTKTVSLSGKSGEQTVDLKLDADWKGRISGIICTDRAGNVSDSKTVGGENGGIIVEDNPPAITIMEADMDDAANPKPGNAVSADYYEENVVPTLYVSVQDEGGDISAGIKSITYSVGGGTKQTVSGNFAAQLSGNYAFTIPLTGCAGVVNVTVEATDYAGNTAQMGVNVKIRGKEAVPKGKPAYLKDALANLTPDAAYEITVPAGDGGTTYVCTADGQGEIPLLLPIADENTIDLCEKIINIVKKGDGTNTTDSDAQTLAIVARPPAPTGEVTPELAQDMDDAVINITVDEAYKGKKEYSTDGGQAWMDVPDDDIIKDLAPGNVLIRMKATEEAPYGWSGTVPVTPSSNRIKMVFALNYADADDASAPDAQTDLTCKKTLDKPEDPSRTGFDFTGWYKSAACKEDERWRFAKTEDGEPNVVGDIIDKTQDKYKDNYTVKDGVITVTLYAGWRENVKPGLNAVLMDDSGQKEEENWYPAFFIDVIYSDNVGVTKLYAKTDGGAYTELAIGNSTGGSTGENDSDGYAQYHFAYNDVEEGEHTYTFKAIDAAGNEAETELTAKLDSTKPVLGEAAFNEGYRNLWDWIMRKDSLIITIPVDEAGSGIDTVEYTLTSVDIQSGNGADGNEDITTGNATVKKISDGSYTATIIIAPDFKGTVTITAKDKAGNVSDTKTIGADGSGIEGVIVEDNAPAITVMADRGTADDTSTQSGGTALSEDYYNSAPKLFVKVEDGAEDGGGITSGLADVSWKIGNGAEQTESADFESDIRTSYGFTINALEGKTGIFQVTVKAVDQVGNTARKTVTVSIKARAEKPTPVIDYFDEKLTGLTPNGKYVIGEETLTADAQGCIEIREEWFGGEYQIHRKGEGNTLDSENADLSIAARPAAPDVSVSKDETVKGRKDAKLAGVAATMEYSEDGGSTWTAVKDSDITDGCMTGCAAGRILFRMKATDSAPCGEPAEISVDSGRPLTVTFEENGGSRVLDLSGKQWHDTVTEPETPVRAGYAFEGWYQDGAYASIWHFASAGAEADLLTDDLTLYAKWRDNAAPAIHAALADGNGKKDGKDWYQDLFVTLTYSDNVGATKLYVKMDGGAYAKLAEGAGGNLGGSTENGKAADGNAQYQYIYNGLEEGEHTYTFKAIDAAGNETETSPLTAKLDSTKPVLGEASFEDGYKNLWDWIIRKESLMITIPVSEAGSGIDAVEYVLTSADGQGKTEGNRTGGSGAGGNGDSVTGNAAVQKVSGDGADYTATITIASDFKGTMTVVVKDKAGNISDTKTIGMDGGGIKGVIVEDNAPLISFAVGRGILSEGYYDEAPELTVYVADGTDEYDEAVITGGIASVAYQVGSGSVKEVDHDYTSDIVTNDSFTIPAAEIPGGATDITVTATDHAGNQAVQSITVRVKAMEETPDAGIGYQAETLTGLVANATYLINDIGMTAEANGTIAIEEDWMPAALSIVRLGNDSSTINSVPQNLPIPARPAAPAVSGKDETYPGAGDGVLTGLSAGTAYEISNDGGSTWKDATLDGTKIRGLAAGTYQVRVKAVEGVSFKSRAAEVTVGTIPATPYETPDAQIGYRQETLTGLVPDAEYIVEYSGGTGEGEESEEEDGADAMIFKADADGNITIDEKWFGMALSVVRKGNGKEKSDSEAQSLPIPNRPQTPSPVGVDETRPGSKDAKLTGLTADISYDISADGGKTWVSRTADADGEIKDVDAPASYIVRVSATDSTFASLPSKSVMVDEMKATYTVTLHGNGGSGGTALTSYTYGMGETLPADWTKTGYTFDGWYDNENLTGTAVTNISDKAAGNKEYWAKWTDNIAPVIGTLEYSYQPKNLWQWLIGKESLIIKAPVTEEGSGADEVTYVVTSEGGTASTDVSEITSGAAKITVSADFKGTIAITCTDKAGNTSAGVTVGAGLNAAGIIIEDHAPDITTDAKTGYYDTAPAINVTVTDDKDNAVSGGIASITYQVDDGEPKSVSIDKSALQTEVTFTIPASEISAEKTETGIIISAEDNAGNMASEMIAVKFKKSEETPDVDGDYQPENPPKKDGGTDKKPENPPKKDGGTDKKPDDTPPTDRTPPTGNTLPTDSNPPAGDTPPTGSNPSADNTPSTGNNPSAGDTPSTGSNPPADNTPSIGSMPDKTGDSPSTDSVPDKAGNPPIGGAVKTVPASIEGGRIVVSGETFMTGNVAGMKGKSTALKLENGAVIVTVVCEDEGYAAGVKDTIAVANAVLTPEQIQLANDGETIEVRIDVKDISATVAEQDKEVIESGLTEYRKEIQELTLGMYVDISMFIRIGEGDWDAVTATKEPIEVIIGIPEELQEDGREFYIIRSHEGEYTLLNDTDNGPDTITISTDMFSAYAIAYQQADTDNAPGGNAKCGLCHICPTFLGICYFIWLAIIIAAILVIVVIVCRRKKDEDKKQAAGK